MSTTISEKIRGLHFSADELRALTDWAEPVIEDYLSLIDNIALIADEAATDHGALTGLADDDHTQYFLADGTRNLSGDLVMDGGDNDVTISNTGGQFSIVPSGEGTAFNNYSGTDLFDYLAMWSRYDTYYGADFSTTPSVDQVYMAFWGDLPNYTGVWFKAGLGAHDYFIMYADTLTDGVFFSPEIAESGVVKLGMDTRRWGDFFTDGVITQGGGSYDIITTNSGTVYSIVPETNAVVDFWLGDNVADIWWKNMYMWGQGTYFDAGVSTPDDATYGAVGGMYNLGTPYARAFLYIGLAGNYSEMILEDDGTDIYIAPYTNKAGAIVDIGNASKPWGDLFLDGVITHGGGTYDITYNSSGLDYWIEPDTHDVAYYSIGNNNTGVRFNWIGAISSSEAQIGVTIDASNQTYVYQWADGATESGIWLGARLLGTYMEVGLKLTATDTSFRPVIDGTRIDDIDLGIDSAPWNDFYLKGDLVHKGGTYKIVYTNSGTDYTVKPDTGGVVDVVHGDWDGDYQFHTWGAIADNATDIGCVNDNTWANYMFETCHAYPPNGVAWWAWGETVADGYFELEFGRVTANDSDLHMRAVSNDNNPIHLGIDTARWEDFFMDGIFTLGGGTYDIEYEGSGTDYLITDASGNMNKYESGFASNLIGSTNYSSIFFDDTYYGEIGVDGGVSSAYAKCWMYNYHATYGSQAVTMKLDADESHFAPEYGTIDLGTDTYKWADFHLDGEMHQNTDMKQYSGSKTLTDGVATGVFEVTLPNNSMGGGMLKYSIEATDGTDFQIHSGIVTFAGVNKAGTVTSDIDEVYLAASETKVLTSGTLTDTWSIVNGTGKMTITLNANSSLAGVTVTIKYTVILNNNKTIVPL